jgi:hypothetical protein
MDASQRLRTIEEFIYYGFQLGELEPLNCLSGFRFDDLLESRQRKFKNRSVRGIVLNEHADEAARLDMFERINTGSKNANTAEIRRGALAGPFLDLVIELANLEQLARLAPMPSKTKKERGYEELVTRFFAYGDGLESYRDRPSEFLFAYAKTMNEKLATDPKLAEVYRRRFGVVLDFVEKNFPFGFRKVVKGKSTPRARFEAIALGVAKALEQHPELSEVDTGELGVVSWIGQPEFQQITGADGANAIARLRGRIDFVAQKLMSHVDN